MTQIYKLMIKARFGSGETEVQKKKDRVTLVLLPASVLLRWGIEDGRSAGLTWSEARTAQREIFAFHDSRNRRRPDVRIVADRASAPESAHG